MSPRYDLLTYSLCRKSLSVIHWLVDGGWSPWQLWSECSQSCGRGMHTRKRLCTHPNPQNGGFDCWGNSTDTEQCNTQDCPPVDGQWSPWLNWGACSVTCGGGTQIRVRSCTKPAPQWGGKTCQGQRGELQTCSTEQCPPGIHETSLHFALHNTQHTQCHSYMQNSLSR